MPDLHGWITQQIDKTEAVARHAPGCLGRPVQFTSAPFLGDCGCEGDAAVLRRCAADRKILEVHAPAGGDWEPYACEGCGRDSEWGWLVDHTNDCETLQALAEGYGLTEEQRASLDRPEAERPEPTGPSLIPDVLTEALYGQLVATFLGTVPVETAKDKAIKILEPELKKIAGYVPIAEEPGPA